MTRLFFYNGLALLFMLSCSQASSELQETVTIYTRLLAEAYNNQEVSRLEIVASPAQVEKVFHHMASFREGGVRMETRLTELTFLENQETSETSWQLETREKWEYSYFHLQTGARVTHNTITYTLRYTLVKDQQNWIIAGVEVLSAQEVEKEQDLLFLQRPRDSKARALTR